MSSGFNSSGRAQRAGVVLGVCFALILVACGNRAQVGQQSSAATSSPVESELSISLSAPTVVPIDVPTPTYLLPKPGSTTTLPPEPAADPNTTIGFPPAGTTTLYRSDSVHPTPTSLPVGPADPTGDTLPGLPLHLTLTYADLQISPTDPRYNAALAAEVFTVGVGAIVRFVMTPDPDWRQYATSNFTIDDRDESVLMPIKDRGTCPVDSVCSTFAADQTGSAEVFINGVSGGIIAAEGYKVIITVS